MLRIYGSAKSRALRVIWMAGELGIAYEHKDWLPRSPETRTPEFHALLGTAGREEGARDAGITSLIRRDALCALRPARLTKSMNAKGAKVRKVAQRKAKHQ